MEQDKDSFIVVKGVNNKPITQIYQVRNILFAYFQ